MTAIDEQEFLSEYRQTGLIWSAYACVATASLLLLFVLFPILSLNVPDAATVIRLVLLGVVSVIAYLLLVRRQFAIRNYVFIVASGSVVSLSGIALIVAIPSFGTVSSDFSPLPAMMFALLLNYGFLRLPLRWCASICWFFSVVIVWASPAAFSGSGQLRTLLYLVSSNVLGMVLCRSIEARERDLFHERRRAERAQLAYKERAQEAEEAHMDKTRLIAAVSHDLRQPMMAARTYVGALMRRLERGDLDQAVRQSALLDKSIASLGDMLDHLLTAARYDSGSEPIHVDWTDLDSLMSRVRETFAPEAAARGLELRIRVPKQRIALHTDAVALSRVLMNLVSNGLKFTEPRAKSGRGVLIAVRLIEGRCRIDVVDTGVGIDAQHLESIWQPYFQVDNEERRRDRGMGLGLFLVRRAIDHLPEHQLSIRSRVGHGSRFTISLPGKLINESTESRFDRRGLDDADFESLFGGFALILEDDDDARLALEELLAGWGMVHASSSNLHDLMRSNDDEMRMPDVIISDFRLPGELDGTDSVRVLRRQLGADVPAILITGESDLASIRERLPKHCVLLQKPFDPHALAIPIVAAIRQARQAEGA
jgi:signal transduction histidine kinase/CheY-like chemotaxis protein